MLTTQLQKYLHQVYAPARRISKRRVYDFGRMITWLRRALRREPTVADLCADVARMFQESILDMGQSETLAAELLDSFRTLWRFAADRGDVASSPDARPRRPYERGKLPLPVGDSGTLLKFFWDVYLPEVLNVAGASPIDYWTMFRKCRECFGRDLRLKELSGAVVAKFVSWLQSEGIAPLTVKKHRGNLLTVWRAAHAEELAPALPTVRPIKVPIDPPDAWSLVEFARMVEAAKQLRKGPIDGVPANDFWTAILLVAYYTALRRSTLLRIRTCDMDLESAWLYVPGRSIKNGRGQRFRLGPDAVAAVKAIYDPDRALLFPHPGDQRLRLHFHDILKGAGLPTRGRHSMSRFHKIRRTTITHTAARAGLAAAIALAGHSGPEVNARYLDARFLPQHDATQWLPPASSAAG